MGFIDTLKRDDNMNMSKEQVQMAVQSGLELLGPESEVKVPTKLNDGVFFLKGLLAGIAQGRISLSTAVQEEAPQAPPPGPVATKGPPADPKKKRQAKKKATSKKK